MTSIVLKPHASVDSHSPLLCATFSHVQKHPGQNTLQGVDRLLAAADGSLRVWLPAIRATFEPGGTIPE